MQIKATTHHGSNYDETTFTADSWVQFQAILATGYYPYQVDDIKAHNKYSELVDTGKTDVGWTRYEVVNAVTLDGVQVRIDGDLIGWMADWGAPWERDWLDKGWVTTVGHNSGGHGGFSLRITDAGREQITKEVE